MKFNPLYINLFIFILLLSVCFLVNTFFIQAQVIEPEGLNSAIVNQDLAVIGFEQDEYYQFNGTYKQYPRDICPSGECEVHEYVMPNGVAGYQMFFYKDHEMRSIGFGPESSARTYFITGELPIATTTPKL